ncbi:MAG TPA: transposase [Chitinophagaceae bacterium]|nr:transposase [Chitinophagaceae bacterium]
MSKKYKFADNDKFYFVSFAVINWIDLFIRNDYKEEILNSIKYCQEKEDMELYGWCIMTSHVHLIIGTRGNLLQNIMRDLKRHTSEVLHTTIKNNNTESRKEWILWIACPDFFREWKEQQRKIVIQQSFNCGNLKIIRFS